jgi:hypothetical protein
MPENTSLVGSIDGFDLEFVERQATPELLMKLGVQLHLAGLSLSNIISILIYLVLIRHDQLFTTGCTRQIYELIVADHRITLGWTRR